MRHCKKSFQLTMYKYLVSRWADVAIGVTVGVSAYYLHERRINKPEGSRLNDIISRKWNGKE